MTGYYDYLIVLTPSQSVVNRVNQLKEYSAGVIGDYVSRHAKAHITVQTLSRQKPEYIEPLFPKLERDLQKLPPLLMEINGYNYFNSDNPTIYAKLDSTALTKVWFKNLRAFFNAPAYEPHITITRGIDSNSFRKLWPHFKNFEWTEKFLVNELTILKREAFSITRSYDVVKQIPFNKRLDFFQFAGSKLNAMPAMANTGALQFSLF